ncbi:MAG TPA: M28 family peptidase [Candidatus Polarisedimenticolia bacterium]|nr:M28 family peptidase [Candidatus Polarisedimenticolia bacterium]
MTRPCQATLFAAAAAAAACLGAAAPSLAPEARLMERALASGALEDDLEHLTQRIGGRVTGTPASERSIDWAASRLRQAGVSVSLEEFAVPRFWDDGEAEVWAVSPERFPLPAVACPGSLATPAGAIEAAVVDAGSGTPEDFSRLGPAAAGAVALVGTRPMEGLGDLFAEYLRDRPMMEAARRAGIAALMVMSNRPRGLLYSHPVRLDGTPAPLPVALVAREPAERLRRLMAHGPARVRLRLAPREGGPFTSRNVIGEIRGSARPGEIVLLGAHLDSWGLGEGAEDNGVNAALVIDVARGFRELGLTPSRTVRFALFTGEEQGLWGSASYVRRHGEEMDRHAAAVIHDTGSGRVRGYYLNGREELRAPVEEALRPAASLGPFQHPLDAVDGTDNFDFLLAGVPNLLADQEAGPYLPDYHAESDTFDKVDREQARRNAAVAAVLVWGLAQAEAPPGRRQTRQEVAALLERSGLEPVMRSFGQWEGWAGGSRPGSGQAPPPSKED